VTRQVASLRRQLTSYEEQAKQWETLRQQLCKRVAQLEGKQLAVTSTQQHDVAQARKFEVLAMQRAEENTELRGKLAHTEEALSTQQLECDKLRKRLAGVEEESKTARSDYEAYKRIRSTQQAQINKLEADLCLAQGQAASALRMKDDLHGEKERLVRANTQLSGEVSSLRLKIGYAGSDNRSANAFNNLGTSISQQQIHSGYSMLSRNKLSASALGVESELPSFSQAQIQQDLSPASAYHVSTDSHLGNEISNIGESSIVDQDAAGLQHEVSSCECPYVAERQQTRVPQHDSKHVFCALRLSSLSNLSLTLVLLSLSYNVL